MKEQFHTMKMILTASQNRLFKQKDVTNSVSKGFLLMKLSQIIVYLLLFEMIKKLLLSHFFYLNWVYFIKKVEKLLKNLLKV